MRRLAIFIVSAVIVASCGVSRDDQAGPDASDDTVAEGAATTQPTDDTQLTTTTAGPTTTAPAGDVAGTIEFSDGITIEVLYGDINQITVPTAENTEFVDLVYRGSPPPNFDAIVLSQAILGAVMANELTKLGIDDPSRAQLDEAKELLFAQLLQSMPSSSDPASDAERFYEEVPYLPFIVRLQAQNVALAEGLAAAAPQSDANPCVRHILVETEEEATGLLDELNTGADFATLAIERSIDPGAASGGELGCAPTAGYVAEFATAVQQAEVGEIMGPVETQFGWHLLVVEGYEADGQELARARLNAQLLEATVTVDDRVGSWDETQLTVVPDDATG